MIEFQVIYPCQQLAAYVKQYWFLKMKNISSCVQRLVPFGCVALNFYREDKAFSLTDEVHFPQSFIQGITNKYSDISVVNDIDFVCIVFQPVGINALFKIPIGEFNNSCVSVDSLSDRQLLELEQKIKDEKNNRRCVEVIEEFLISRIYSLNRYQDKRMAAILYAIAGGQTDIRNLADIACLGYKQFKRIFANNIGANPKDYLKIVRFQKLHRLMQHHVGMSVSELVDECGYYDKSHLIQELKSFTGLTPSELAKACDAHYSAHYSLFRSAFVDRPLIL